MSPLQRELGNLLRSKAGGPDRPGNDISLAEPKRLARLDHPRLIHANAAGRQACSMTKGEAASSHER
eukprot:3739498-Pyramimonas_sp.AAC.1